MSAAARQSKAVRTRLAAFNLAVSALVLAVTLGSAAISAVRSHASAVDAGLREAGGRVVLAIQHEREERGEPRSAARTHDDDDDHEDDDHRERGRSKSPTPRPSQSSDALANLHIEEEPGTIVMVAGATGAPRRVDGETMPSGLPDTSAIEAALGGRETFSDVSLKGSPARTLSLPIRAGDKVIGAVQVARPTAESRAALARTLGILAVTGVLGLLLSLVGSFIVAGRAMRPIELSLERQRRFIADASHELRTPVAVVRARAELLANEAHGLEPATRAELERLALEADELSRLLVDLLDLARLDADQTPLEVGPIPLADIADEVAQQLRPWARGRGVTVTTRGDVVFAQASLARLRQVLRALGDNAVKHSLAGGSVEVVCDRFAGKARARVIDQGNGIAKEHLPHVMDRFYRADPARTRSGGVAGGAGLGLAISHELVQKMGGTLTIESELGKGTTVTLLLPLASAPAAPRHGESP